MPDKSAEHWHRILDGQSEIASWEVATIWPVMESFTQRKDSKILEIGSGYGRVLAPLARQANGICIGLDRYILPQAESSYGAVCGDVRRLPFQSNMFDLVFSLGVVEHFPETDEAIREHFRVAKPGGTVIVTTPRLCITSPLRGIAYLMRHRRYGTFEQTLGRNLTLSYLRKTVSESGGDIQTICPAGLYFPGISYQRRRYLERLLPSWLFGAFAIVIAQKT